MNIAINNSAQIIIYSQYEIVNFDYACTKYAYMYWLLWNFIFHTHIRCTYIYLGGALGCHHG